LDASHDATFWSAQRDVSFCICVYQLCGAAPGVFRQRARAGHLGFSGYPLCAHGLRLRSRPRPFCVGKGSRTSSGLVLSRGFCAPSPAGLAVEGPCGSPRLFFRDSPHFRPRTKFPIFGLARYLSPWYNSHDANPVFLHTISETSTS
jgi:hypothetical protein